RTSRRRSTAPGAHHAPGAARIGLPSGAGYLRTDQSRIADRIGPIVSSGMRGAFVMAVNPSVPVTTIPEFIAYSKANPTFPTQSKKPGISRGHPQKSPLQGRCGGLNDLASCGDPRSRLGGQVEVELLHEEFLIGIEFRVAAEDQRARVRCGEMDVEHL